VPSLIALVEGKGEVEAVPVLLRRLVPPILSVARPFLVKRNKVVRPGELERAIQQAQSDRADPAAILVLLDADDDDPNVLRTQLEDRTRLSTTLPHSVVIASREYECWLLAAKESLRGRRGIRPDAVAPPNPDALRDGKGRLSNNMTGGRRYLEVDDQAALSASLDLNLAAGRSPSFDRLRTEVARLVTECGL